MKLRTPLDANQQEVKSAVTHKLAAAPASPVAGQRYYDTTMQAERIYDGASWLTIADQTYVNTAAPTGPLNTGDLWYDTDEVSTIVLPWSVANGGTGATTAAAARTNLAMPGEELAYSQATAQVSITGVSAAGPNLVCEGVSRSYDGSPVIIEFYCGALASPAVAGGFVCINLWDASTDIGQFAFMQTAAAAQTIGQIHAVRRLTPTAGTHNYRIAGWCSGAGGTAYAGAGGIGVWSPMFVRVIRA
jgi:hypothetical protein